MLWMCRGIYNLTDFCKHHYTARCTIAIKIPVGTLALHPTVPQFHICAPGPLFPGARGEPLQTSPPSPDALVLSFYLTPSRLPCLDITVCISSPLS